MSTGVPEICSTQEQMAEVQVYLRSRGLGNGELSHGELMGRFFEIAKRSRYRRLTINRVAALMYMSRRTLGRHCSAAGLPHPSRMLCLIRILNTVSLMRTLGWTACKAARATGWPDPFTFSNSMRRLTGLRPSAAKLMGTILIAESWLQNELQIGGVELRAAKPPECPSCGHEFSVALVDEVCLATG